MYILNAIWFPLGSVLFKNEEQQYYQAFGRKSGD